MKLISISIILLLFTSCSTMRRSKVYGGIVGGIIGGVVGGFAGQKLSPNKDSEFGNSALGASAGIAVGGGLGVLAGKYFFNEDPDNKELPDMILSERKIKKIKNDEIVQMIKVNPTSSKIYKGDLPNIPEHLKDKVLKPYVIEHEIPERVEYSENGKTFIYEASTVIEVGQSL